ncbi:MAG: hypothetical protein RSA79_06630 [Oscillospiraceae bacterium]
MVKKISLILLTIILTINLSGCTYGAIKTTNSIEKNTSNKFSMTYDKLSGYKATEINVKKGQSVEINVNIVTDGGTLNAYIAKDNKKEDAVYNGEELKTSEFNVTLSEEGKYTIRIDAEDHSGSYAFVW